MKKVKSICQVDSWHIEISVWVKSVKWVFLIAQRDLKMFGKMLWWHSAAQSNLVFILTLQLTSKPWLVQLSYELYQWCPKQYKQIKMQTNYVEKGQLYGKYTRMWLWKEYCHWSSKLGSRTKFSSWAGVLPETPLAPTAKNVSCIRWIYKAWAFYDTLGTNKDCIFHQGQWWKMWL